MAGDQTARREIPTKKLFRRFALFSLPPLHFHCRLTSLSTPSLTLQGSVWQRKARAEVQSNIPFINHASTRCQKGNCASVSPFKEGDFITGLTHRAAPLFSGITHSSGNNQSGNAVLLPSGVTISVWRLWEDTNTGFSCFMGTSHGYNDLYNPKPAHHRNLFYLFIIFFTFLKYLI